MIISDHATYHAFLSTQILTQAESTPFWEQLSTYAEELSILADLSFDPVHDALAALYCPHGNGSPRDPSAMLRSWLLMTLCREGSPTVWATRLRREPVLALLAGFEPDNPAFHIQHKHNGLGGFDQRFREVAFPAQSLLSSPATRKIIQPVR